MDEHSSCSAGSPTFGVVSLSYCNHSCGYPVISLCSLKLHLPNDLCAYLPFTYLLWWSVCSDPLPFFNWVICLITKFDEHFLIPKCELLKALAARGMWCCGSEQRPQEIIGVWILDLPLVAVRSWTIYLGSLGISFLISNMEVLMKPMSQRCYEDWMR